MQAFVVDLVAREKLPPLIKISIQCTSCRAHLEETIMHHFLHYEKTRHAWYFAFLMVHLALRTPTTASHWPVLSWQQCVLEAKFPKRLKNGLSMWSIFCRSIILVVWLDHNTICLSKWCGRPLLTMYKWRDWRCPNFVSFAWTRLMFSSRGLTIYGSKRTSLECAPI